MATAMDVLEMAIHLSDNGDESTGKWDIPDNKEYKNRLVAILNTFLSELYPYSDTCSRETGKRPVHPRLTSVDDEIDLDGYCLEVAAYGLGARLFTDENGNIASYYQQEYERRLAWLQSGGGLASEGEAITDVYAGGYYDADGNYHYYTGYYPHNDFSKWA